MKQLSFITSILLTVSVMLLTSCESGKYSGFKQTHSGIYYKIHTPDNPDTVRVREGMIVTVDMKYGTEDSVLYNSSSSPQEVRFPIQPSLYEGDMYEAFQLFVKGDSATFVIKAAPFFQKTVKQPTLPPGISEEDDLIFDVRFIDVQSQEDLEATEMARAQMLRDEEPLIVQAYVDEHNISVEPTESGIYYIEKKKGKGKNPKKDDWVSVHFTVWKLNGEKLFSTYDRTDEPMDFEFGGRFENEGFQQALGMMKEGGKAEALIPSVLAFGAQGAGQVVPPYAPLFYEIDLVDVMTIDEWDRKQSDRKALKLADKLKKQAAEKEQIKKYIADNKLIPTEELPSGIVYVEEVKGAGIKPGIGSKVKVHYTGKLLDGSVFDSSVDRGQPFEFVIGRGMVIKGWDKGIALMNVGSKGTLIIPFEQGYDSRESGSIPAYSTLVFDVELLEIVEEEGDK